jgi:histidine ammonia-lyase
VTVSVASRSDFNLENYERVAWLGEFTELTPAAKNRICDARLAFIEFVRVNPKVRVYGANTRVGPGAANILEAAELTHFAQRRPGAAGVSFGEPLPLRVVRGILFSRLANYIEGNSAITLPLAEAVASMLDGRPLPAVPAFGNGAAGEINALAHLFHDLSGTLEMGPKDNIALTNGAPCASALVADAVLVARRRLDLSHKVFALAVDAFKAALEHYDPVLGECWGNPHDKMALQALAPYLRDAASDRRDYQAPVSFRIMPRILGQAHQALQQAEQTAGWSLPSITDNPTYLPPDTAGLSASTYPHGRILHTGGFHNAAAYTAMDALAGASADLVLIADRLTAKTLDGDVSGLPHGLRGAAMDDVVRYLPGAVVAFGEQARRAAQRNFLPASGEYAATGQSDVAVPTFSAWRSQREAGRCLDCALAVLAVTALQALEVTHRAPPSPLQALCDQIRCAVPAIDAARVLGPDLHILADEFSKDVEPDHSPTDFAVGNH